MKKAKIKIEINDYTINQEGIIDNDVLIVHNKEEKITFDLKNLILHKENKELIIDMDFNKKKIKYEIVTEKRQFSNDFTIISLTNSNNQYIINYRIEETNFLLKINYETI